MKRVLLSMAALSALAAGVPAAAQYQNPTYPSPYPPQNGAYQTNAYGNANMTARIAQLDARLQAGIQSGDISRREAAPLRQQLAQLRDLERRYNRNGLTGQERSDLQQRLRNLRQQIRYADGGARGRYDSYDRDAYGQYDNGYGQNGQYGSNERIDANNDGWDDRDQDRDGRWDDDYANGQYQQPAQRGGIGGIIDSVLGTNSGTLRVGQRASANLGGVPYEYQNQYRDGNGVYYRSDGRAIYQIDARTQNVVRVYGMNR
jgi:hypothetical protein